MVRSSSVRALEPEKMTKTKWELTYGTPCRNPGSSPACVISCFCCSRLMMMTRTCWWGAGRGWRRASSARTSSASRTRGCGGCPPRGPQQSRESPHPAAAAAAAAAAARPPGPSHVGVVIRDEGCEDDLLLQPLLGSLMSSGRGWGDCDCCRQLEVASEI